MFTLKLFKRRNGQEVSRVVSVHHVQVMEIGPARRMLEIWAFHDQEPSPYDVYYVGERESDMDAVNFDNHWGWALLENSDGNTTEHYRPCGWGWEMPVATGEASARIAA